LANAATAQSDRPSWRHGLCAENTLASFREARRRGATWVEIDVKLTADGVPIVMHDASLKRTMGVDRLVAETPRAELPRDVPTFEEAIACFAELGLGCNVEIKPREGREARTARVAVRPLRRLGPRPCRRRAVRASRRCRSPPHAMSAPEFARAILSSSSRTDWRSRPMRSGRRGINTNGEKLTAARALEVKRAGFALSVYTIDDPTLARMLVGMGVDCVITDSPT
jgi:glycerophosphoryl diester phosphodiesterase